MTQRQQRTALSYTCTHDEQTACEPSSYHSHHKEEEQRLGFNLDILPRECDTCEQDLNRNHDSGHSEASEVEINKFHTSSDDTDVIGFDIPREEYVS
jgi:4-alpha-glucanotransferase